MQKTVLKICCSEWLNASRDKRELSVCHELGAEVLVMAKGNPEDKYKSDEVAGFPVLRFSTRPLGTKIPNSINRLISIFFWAYYANKLKPDVVTGHDLDGLVIGWLSTLFLPKAKKPKLVYDSHEFEIGRLTKRSRIGTLFVTYLERFLIKRCDLSIMVNEVIADKVQRIHQLKNRPIVVCSTPNLWNVDSAECKKVRKALCEGFDPDSTLLMYHGGVVNGRGIETLLRAVAANVNVCAVVLGNGSDKYLSELQKQVKKLGIEKRIRFHPAVAITELWKYVGAADIGMILAPAIVANHLYSLPNKFFENIQSETPIICPAYPAMKPIVDHYHIGLTCDPEKLEEINACIEKMRTDTSFYNICKDNTRWAKKELCWEKEKQKLLEAYNTILTC